MKDFKSFEAKNDWRHARRKLLYKEVVCLFKGCSVDLLLPFDEVRKKLQLYQHFDRGVQEIPLERIRGSVGRYEDFTATFLPRKDHLRKRWESVDVAMGEGKTPPIDVYQVGNIYFVVDGNHRVSIAREHGQETIDAYVEEFPVPFEFSAGDDIDQALINVEHEIFINQAGEANVDAALSMRFTCPGCYKDITAQIEIYRKGQEEIWDKPMSFEQAFSAWNEEVYAPTIEAVYQNDLLAQFPDRTAADLFIWSWRNNQEIELLEGGNDPQESVNSGSN